MTASFEENTFLLAIFEQRPVFVAELRMRRDAIFVAQRQFDNNAVFDDTLWKGIGAQEFLEKNILDFSIRWNWRRTKTVYNLYLSRIST